MQKLSVKECIGYGWRTVKARLGFFISSSAILLLAGMVGSLPRSFSHTHGITLTLVGIVGFIVSMLISFLINMGKTAFYLKAHDSVGTVELSNLWHPYPYWKFVGASILAGIAMVVGLILLIIPGIIIGITFGFALYIVIEDGTGPVEALKRSASITRGNRFQLFLLGLALVGINILGALLLLVGLLVTVPISSIAIVHAYRTLSKNEIVTV